MIHLIQILSCLKIISHQFYLTGVDEVIHPSFRWLALPRKTKWICVAPHLILWRSSSPSTTRYSSENFQSWSFERPTWPSRYSSCLLICWTNIVVQHIVPPSMLFAFANSQKTIYRSQDFSPKDTRAAFTTLSSRPYFGTIYCDVRRETTSFFQLPTQCKVSYLLTKFHVNRTI